MLVKCYSSGVNSLYLLYYFMFARPQFVHRQIEYLCIYPIEGTMTRCGIYLLVLCCFEWSHRAGRPQFGRRTRKIVHRRRFRGARRRPLIGLPADESIRAVARRPAATILCTACH